MLSVVNAEETSKHFFALGPSFLDPQKTSDGQPYGPKRYKQIVKECYLIAKNCNTPYTNLLDITPSEKNLLLDLILEENRRSQEQIEKVKAESRRKRERR